MIQLVLSNCSKICNGGKIQIEWPQIGMVLDSCTMKRYTGNLNTGVYKDYLFVVSLLTELNWDRTNHYEGATLKELHIVCRSLALL